MTTVTDMRGRSFLTLADFSPEELTYLLDLAAAAQGRSRETDARSRSSRARRSR